MRIDRRITAAGTASATDATPVLSPNPPPLGHASIDLTHLSDGCAPTLSQYLTRSPLMRTSLIPSFEAIGS